MSGLGPGGAMWLLLAGGVLVLGVGVWLRRCQARFVAELRAAGDPLAEHPATKTFRQRFQAWLFGLGENAGGPAPGRSLLTLAMLLLLGAIAVYSLLPGLFA